MVRHLSPSRFGRTVLVSGLVSERSSPMGGATPALAFNCGYARASAARVSAAGFTQVVTAKTISPSGGALPVTHTAQR